MSKQKPRRQQARDRDISWEILPLETCGASGLSKDTRIYQHLSFEAMSLQGGISESEEGDRRRSGGGEPAGWVKYHL
jgi:hypothetical protein